jgi:3-hydroxymyristoyl/3-hydroxydecanoyl-(acyl carrier protein) dehydratase/1-acyl-sn-glycerol-3-phosphate acyltransferase
MLLMLDRITGYWPEGGRAGLGYLRAEKDVDPAEWFFKAHFFQDPVQPGSLGMEAMCQLLQFHIIESGMASGVETPRFEPLMLDRQVTWKFRGQVIPANCKITIEMEIVASGADGRGTFAVADAWLWVDGKRIYQAQGIGMRVRSAADPKPKLPRHDAEFLLDPAVDIWLEDHRPTWTFPVLPMMSMVDSMAAAAANHAGRQVAVLRDVQIRRWVPFSEGAVRFCTRVAGSTADEEQNVTLFAWREAGDPALSRFEAVAEARAAFTDSQQPPPAFEPLKDTVPIPNPYGAGSLFHGPSFHYLIELRLGSTGSSGILSTEQGTVPRGYLHQGILDAATHAIPHDTLWQWSAEIPRGHASYPYRIPEMHFYAPLPDSGHIQIETRFAGFEGGPRFPAVEIQLLAVGEVLVVFRLVLVLHPKGNIGGAKPEARLAFLRDKQYVAGLALSRFDGETTTLTEAEVRQSDWLPGNLAFIYSIPLERRTRMTAEIAVREHVASRLQVHPSTIVVGADLTNASATTRPLFRQPLNVSSSRDTVSVRNAGPAIQDLTQVRSYWRERMGVGPWPIEDLYFGLIERFVGDVVIADPEAFAAARGRSCLYVANHQVAIESLLFSVLISALSAAPAVTLAKAEHRTSWLGWLIAHTAAYPGVNDPKLIAFFEREDRESLVKIVAELAEQMRSGNRSAMVHVEGTRSLACRRPVVKMSSTFIDMALAVDAPIIPVRFIGGLPAEELAKRLEFPVGLGRQDYWIGCPILPKQLAALPYKERKEVVISAMNDLGPDLLMEMPAAPDPTFAAAVEDWMTRTGATLEDAVFFATLAASPSPQEGIRTICEAARNGHLVVGTTAREAWLGRWAERLYGPRGPQVVWTKD